MLPYSPRAAADVIIELGADRFVLVRRRNPPFGWAIPGGFIDEDESADHAAVREAREETGLDVRLTELFHAYSDPGRDPRHHTLSVVFLGESEGDPIGGDDAADARVFTSATTPHDLAFDHARILSDYFRYRATGQRPEPDPSRRASLTQAERAGLLHLARSAIAEVLGVENPPLSPLPSACLSEPGSAFVSLHRDGELRGCIGSFARDRTLAEIVHDMALAAAFEDPRFPPLAAHELASLDIEISVLSKLRPTPPEAILAGYHGVSVALNGRKGVFLPQVAREAGWDRDTLLAQACLKAGLPPDAWRDPAVEISAFTAEIFGEES
jgi:AmmeMemoRadiSam system protein A